MAVGVGGLLHTSSKYAQDIHYTYTGLNDNSKSRIASKISSLKANEKKFYQLFGASDFNSFRTKINSWFNEGDIQFLKSFENQLLKTENSLFSFFKGNRGEILKDEGQDIKVTIKAEDIEKLTLPGFQIKTKGQTIHSENIEINLGMKINKNEIQKVFSNYFERSSTSKKTGGITNKEINKMLSSVDNRQFFQIEANGQDTTTVEFFLNMGANQFLGFTKAEIQKVLTNSEDPNYRQLREFISRARNRINDYIFNILMGQAAVSQEMRMATARVWGQLSDANDPSGAKLVQYFSGGGNYVNVFVGAMGEFQSAVMMEYLMIKAGLRGSQAKIIGQEMINGVQPKRDVMVQWAAGLGNQVGFGIQVKNYSKRQNTIDTSMNFGAEIERLGEGVDEDFFSFISNYFFNKTFQSERENEFEAVKNFFSDQIIELYNLQTDETLSSDKITFYHISANTLVPASAIAEAAYKISNMRQPVSVSSTYKGKSDEEFEQGTPPLYLKYWNNKEPNTGVMQSEIQNIYNSITIRGGFDYSSLLEQYSLY